MKLNEKKFENLKISIGNCSPRGHLQDAAQRIKEKDFNQLEIAEIIWLELFSGDLNPADLVIALLEIREYMKAPGINYHGSVYLLDIYISSLKDGNYLYWTYSDLSWINYNFPKSKKILEAIL